ncbi:MAG: rod shape-determining protein MreC [Waddliaceae bacterium]
MKRTKFSKSFLPLFTTLLLLMSIPRTASEKIQGTTVALLAPFWEQIDHIKSNISGISQKILRAARQSRPANSENSSRICEESKRQHNRSNQADSMDRPTADIQKLQLENQLLSNEVARLKSILSGELPLYGQTDDPFNEELAVLQPLLQRHQRDLQRILVRQLTSAPAQVIFRSPSTWDHSLWINVGKALNETLGKEVIAKNSPVFVGRSIVGVIDYVGKKQSRVRLITDSGLTPSVRAVRQQEGKTRHLAKGELHGKVTSSWPNHRQILKGAGFNYDFPDEEGPARDLRTGAPVGDREGVPVLPILQQDDLLVTTGMDGVFPPGFEVATVSSIDLLKEGDYYYELEAVPTAGNFDDLSLVFVLPPVGYDPADKPPHIRNRQH